jgi:hypothetical protein
LSRKIDEILILKKHNIDSKKEFASKVTQIKQEFNNKLLMYAKHTYQNATETPNILIESTMAMNKSQVRDSLASSVLRMSHLTSSKPLVQNDALLCLKNMQEIENIDDLISVHNRLIDQVIDLQKQNKLLSMQVVYSDTKLYEDTLSM